MKVKTKVSFVCQECGYDSPSWLGKCPECGVWNSMKEIQVQSVKGRIQSGGGVFENIKPQKINDIAYSEKLRIQTKFNELNTVLGGGFVKGSVTLLAGDPGVGKSTLLLQLALSLAMDKRRILYVNGEESSEQVKMRAERIGLSGESGENLFLVSLSDTEAIVAQIEEMKPDLVVIDSIQMVESQNVSSLSGSVAQVRYGALQFVRSAKKNSIPIVIVGHVTKEGQVAGPMILSHMVDTVLFIEGERFTQTRILRSLKNRFGPVDEVGIFLMDEVGMKEASNPEQLFIGSGSSMGGRLSEPGSVLVATLEGSRAFLVEIQALVVRSGLPMPRRVVSGMDQRRVELLLAVLQKHCRIPLETMDVFVNVAGGLKLSDPGVDLGVCLAVFSSFANMSLTDVVGVAEVGLLGELRVIAGLDKRVREAEKLGFKRILTAKKHKTLNGVIGELRSKK